MVKHSLFCQEENSMVEAGKIVNQKLMGSLGERWGVLTEEVYGESGEDTDLRPQ